MPGLSRLLRRRVGFWGISLALWELWKRIPPKHRKRLIGQARKHGPRYAKRVYRAGRGRRR